MTHSTSPRSRPVRLAAAALLLLAGVAGAQEADQSYGFVRTLEGAATLLQGGGESHDRVDLEVNAPVIDGDRIWVARGSRLEVVLPDRNLLRLDGATEVGLESLAYSQGSDARSTHLRLDRGELQLVVVADALGEELPRLDTANATLYVQTSGSFLVRSEGEDWTEVVVRQGTVEVLTPRGTSRVLEGERLEIAGDDRPQVELSSAGPEAALERWGRALDDEIATADLRYVDSGLRYAAGGLEGRGTWVEVGAQRAWRPRVAAGWRPFTDGYWSPTPAGLTWVSYEPWGWATYHYGNWDHVPGWGWVWYPGRVFSPAWVYWYWGPTHIGWCPTGYYSGFYGRNRHAGFRHGVHGWAGGGWDAFADWTFCDTGRFWQRGLRGHSWSGRDLRHRSRLDAVPRGLITTDTRGLRPGMEGRPQDIVEVVRRARGTRPGEAGGALPDVTAFVARRPELPPDVTRAVLDSPADLGQAPRSIRPEIREPPTVLTRPRTVAPADRPEGWRGEERPRRLAVDRPAGPSGQRGSGGATGDGEGARRITRERPTSLDRPEPDQRSDERREGTAIRRATPRPTEAWRAGVRPPARVASPTPGATAGREPVVRRVVEGILDGSSRHTTQRPAPERRERAATPSSPPPAARAAAPPPSRPAAERSSGAERRGAEPRGAERQRSRERPPRGDGERP